VSSLEHRWSNWVVAGSPELQGGDNTMVAQASADAQRKGLVIRSQSPDNMISPLPQRQDARAARPAKSLPRGDNLEAPDPAVAIASDSAESSRTHADVSDANQWSRRRAGRERVVQEGWEPVVDANREPAVSRTASNVARSARVSESPARRRFQDARDRQTADAQSPTMQGPDPFDETPVRPNELEVKSAESPFHMEN
jgi:hypothetical protein